MKGEEKYFFCLFLKEGHETWRMAMNDNLTALEKDLSKSKQKIIKKRFFEVDRRTGNMEEF